MDNLILRNMNYDFYYSGVYEINNCYIQSFYNSDSNNLLLFDTSDCDEITVESICNSTVSKGAYDYLINVLNTNKNVLVYWSQVEGTTSDYTIYHNSDNESIIQEDITLENALETNNSLGFKFTEVNNKNMTNIEF